MSVFKTVIAPILWVGQATQVAHADAHLNRIATNQNNGIQENVNVNALQLAATLVWPLMPNHALVRVFAIAIPIVHPALNGH